jgi:phenylacetic acid degradation operon negative regulatory protein
LGVHLFFRIFLMKASTEEFLLTLLWTADWISRPTWRNLNETFESWAYRNALGRRLANLEHRKFLERQPTSDMSRVYRLTSEGRRMAPGGGDPQERWERSWDGHWRIMMFDLPMRASALRARLRRFLLQHGFGYLQQSVWITPDGLEEVQQKLQDLPAEVESLTLFNGRPCGGEPDAALVRGTWEFPAINALDERHRTIVGECPELPSRRGHPGLRFRAWARREREAWKVAVHKDPLLPRVLLPADYLGRRSWETRKQLFHRLAAGFRR